MAGEKIYCTSSREMLYESAYKDSYICTNCDADVWYEGGDKDEALRIARKYAADTRDTGKVEVYKNGIARNVFEVCETLLDESGDVVDEDSIEIVDPLDRMPKLRELANKADSIHCQLPSYITGECKQVDDVKINGTWHQLYRFELSAFGDFSAFACGFDSAGHPELWLPATFDDYGIQTADQLKDMVESGRGEWWQGCQAEDEYDQILYRLFANA